MAWQQRDSLCNTRLTTIAACLLAAIVIGPRCVLAQSSDFQQRLQTAIEQAQNELEQESERIETENQARQTQLNEARSTCQTLADELIERKLAIAEKQQGLARLRRQREALWTEQTQWQQERTEIESICRDVQRELSQLAGTLPVSELRDKQSQQLSQLEDALEEDNPTKAVSSTVTLIASFLQEARTQTVYETDITICPRPPNRPSPFELPTRRPGSGGRRHCPKACSVRLSPRSSEPQPPMASSGFPSTSRAG